MPTQQEMEQLQSLLGDEEARALLSSYRTHRGRERTNQFREITGMAQIPSARETDRAGLREEWRKAQELINELEDLSRQIDEADFTHRSELAKAHTALMEKMVTANATVASAGVTARGQEQVALINGINELAGQSAAAMAKFYLDEEKSPVAYGKLGERRNAIYNLAQDLPADAGEQRFDFAADLVSNVATDLAEMPDADTAHAYLINLNEAIEDAFGDNSGVNLYTLSEGAFGSGVTTGAGAGFANPGEIVKEAMGRADRAWDVAENQTILLEKERKRLIEQRRTPGGPKGSGLYGDVGTDYSLAMSQAGLDPTAAGGSEGEGGGTRGPGETASNESVRRQIQRIEAHQALIGQEMLQDPITSSAEAAGRLQQTGAFREYLGQSGTGVRPALNQAVRGLKQSERTGGPAAHQHMAGAVGRAPAATPPAPPQPPTPGPFDDAADPSRPMGEPVPAVGAAYDPIKAGKLAERRILEILSEGIGGSRRGPQPQ